MHRPQDHPPVTVNPPRGDRQGDPARRVLATLCRHTRYTGVFSTSCHVTHHAHGYGGDTRGGPRSRSTTLPSYHGRRGATRVKNANSVTWHSGTPAPGDHHIGPTPPHTGNRLDSHQCQRGTGHQSLHGHRAHPAPVTDTGPPSMPLFACRFHLHSFSSAPFGFPRGPFLPADATQSSSSVQTTLRTAGTRSQGLPLLRSQDHQQRNGCTTGSRSHHQSLLIGQHVFTE